MNRYLQQAKADLEKQIQLLEKYLTLRKLQLKTLTLAKTQEEKINTEELNLNTLEFYMIQEEKYIAKLQFYFKICYCFVSFLYSVHEILSPIAHALA